MPGRSTATFNFAVCPRALVKTTKPNIAAHSHAPRLIRISGYRPLHLLKKTI